MLHAVRQDYLFYQFCYSNRTFINKKSFSFVPHTPYRGLAGPWTHWGTFVPPDRPPGPLFPHSKYATGALHSIGPPLNQFAEFAPEIDFVRRDRSSPVKKNVHFFLIVVGVVILFSSAQSATDALF